MRPARMIAAVALTAPVAFAGFTSPTPPPPLRRSIRHHLAPTTTAGSPASTTTAAPTTAVPPSTTPTSQAACTSQVQAASPTAVRALFAISPSPRPGFTGCRSRSLGFDCFYSYSDADGVFFIDMRVEGGASAGFRVVSIDAPLRFASPQSSARHLVDAWLAGDRAEARKAASATAVDAMFSLRDRRHPPSFTGCTYRSFGFDCACTVEGGALTL
jgi:hypothetical protein